VWNMDMVIIIGKLRVKSLNQQLVGTIGRMTMATPYQATVQMISVFRPCPAATVGAMAISTVPATSATGGAPRRTIRTTPGSGSCTTATRAWTGASSSRHSCFRCVVFGTLRPRNSAAIAPRRPDPRLLRHMARPFYPAPQNPRPSHNQSPHPPRT